MRSAPHSVFCGRLFSHSRLVFGDDRTVSDGEAAPGRDALKERKRLLAVVDWSAVRPRLIKYSTARRRDRSRARAEDDVSEALARAYDPAYRAWEPAAEPDIFPYLQSVVNGLVRNDETRAEARGPNATKDAGDALDRVRASASSPEEMANFRALLDACAVNVEKRFGAKGLEFLKVACDGPDEQSAALGLTADQVYHLRHDVFTYCRKVPPELADGSGFLRRLRTREEMALERAIAARLPFMVRNRELLVLLAIFFAVCVIVLGSIAYHQSRR